MNRIGVISDIHANINALDAVISDMKMHQVETILCTGDIVGYHTFPEETVQRLREIDAVCIRGNHDNDVINRQFNSTRLPDIFRFTYDNLSDESLNWLESLPFTRDLTFGGVNIKMVHGSPVDIEEYLFENEPNSEKFAFDCDADILLAGHTHLPWAKQIGSTLFVNSGSVGKPKIGKPLATWAFIEIHDERSSATIKYVDYDVEPIALATEAAGFDRYAESLRMGKA